LQEVLVVVLDKVMVQAVAVLVALEQQLVLRSLLALELL
jgi:hypothetical protein